MGPWKGVTLLNFRLFLAAGDVKGVAMFIFKAIEGEFYLLALLFKSWILLPWSVLPVIYPELIMLGI